MKLVLLLFFLFYIILVNVFSSVNGGDTTIDISDYRVDDDSLKRFDGIGAISGGGSTTRLLIDYEDKDTRDEILDFLFKPNFGASLQILKVEIGGDAQSTDGSESSHMHSADDLNFERGYEWWLLKEAKKRNPDIITYGLPWAFPGWLSEKEKEPFFHPQRAANYTLQWMIGARDVHGINIDILGVWNERGPNPAYLRALRSILNENGFEKVKLVNNDGNNELYLCSELLENKSYANDVDIIGFHYPTDPSDDKERAKSWSPKCQSLNKPIWSSEESSSFDNLNGAACWARIISSHYILNNITSNIMWNLVGSYMHGTNWYASSLLTANQPWSNYYEYETMPVLWATAHYTQFTNPGWRFLPQHKGSGQLPKGGYYVTLISPCRKYFTMIVVKISRDHAPCTRPALFNYDTSDEIFNISFKGFSGDSKVQIWYSNFENEKAVLFQQISQAESTLKNNVFSTSLNVTIGSLFTITNFPKMGVKGIPKHRFKSDPKFPLSYYDDFSKNYKCTNCYAKYLTDQTGSFEIQKNINDSSKALVQTTPKKPLGWVWIGTGPVSIIGMFEWEDIQAKTKFRLPLKQQHIGACLALRTDQNWNHGVSLCVNSTHWFINKGGPPIDDLGKGNVLQKGKINSVLKPYSWNEILIATENSNLIKAELNGISLIKKKINIGNGCGFAGLGVTSFAPVEFQDLKIDPVGSRWIKKNDIINNFKNDELHVGFKPCTPNGLTTDQEEFILTSNWQLLNKATNKCVTVIQKNQLVLKPCKHNYMPQQFRHDYTTVRNAPNELKNEKGQICASLQKNKGSLKICNDTADKDYTIQKFVALPNTNQIRHVYHDGLAMCISIIEKIDGNIEL